MKFKTSKEKHDKLRELVLNTLYPELFELFTNITEEPYYFYIKVPGFNELAISKDKILYKKSTNGGWERMEVRNTIKDNFCPFLDKWNNNSIILSSYVEELIKGIHNLREERQNEEIALNTQIKNIMQLPSICTRVVLTEKIKHE